MAKFGLKIREMSADGNCLFRAIADQLEGNEKLHRNYREASATHIEERKEGFQPFIDDDETFEEFINDLREDATWGGQIEI